MDGWMDRGEKDSSFEEAPQERRRMLGINQSIAAVEAAVRPDGGERVASSACALDPIS